MDDEMLDVVDSHDRVIGKINRKDYKSLLAQKDRFIRASEMFIMNDQGMIWVPIRTANKTIAPNGYDFSAAGHVEAGSDYLDTIIRETKEELNLTINPDDIEFVAKLKSVPIRYMRAIYLLRSNTTPIFNPHDFVSAEWLAPSEFIHQLDAGHSAKYNLRATLIVLQQYLADH